MQNKLFVGNLSWGVTDDMLKQAFEEAGEVVEAKVITDRETNRSRGFGFVTMKDEAGAQKAIEMFDGKELDGREIKVNIARPKQD